MATKKKAQEPVQFNVGDTVHWTSQAGGSTKTKEGKVVEVIPAGSYADAAVKSRVNKGTHRSAFGHGMNRDHASYLIEVPGGTTARAKAVLYWPVASLLRAGAAPKQKRAKN